MKYISHLLSSQPVGTTGVPLRCERLPCPALSTIILEVPYDGGWNDWVVPLLQMLRDGAGAGSQSRKVRMVSNPRVQIPRPGEEKRRQMARLFGGSRSSIFGTRRELYEWQHDEEGSLRMTHGRIAIETLSEKCGITIGL